MRLPSTWVRRVSLGATPTAAWWPPAAPARNRGGWIGRPCYLQIWRNRARYSLPLPPATGALRSSTASCGEWCPSSCWPAAARRCMPVPCHRRTAIVAFCALSGTGKSTLSLAMTTVGVRHFADDTLVYRLVDGRPWRDQSAVSRRVWTPRGSRPFWCRAAAATGDGGLEPFAVPESCLSVVARSRTRPFCAQFTAVPCHRRFEVLLTHSHPT